MGKKKKIDTGNVTLPQSLLDKIDAFNQTKFAEEMAFNSRPDTIIHALRKFFDTQKEVLDQIRPKISLKRVNHDKVVLYDEELDSEVLMLIRDIGGDKVLVCEIDSDPDCPHRNFCLQHPDVHPFIEAHKMKIVRVRK